MSTTPEDEARERIAERLRDLADLSKVNAHRLLAKARLWRVVGVLLGLLAASLAAGAGATGLSESLSKETIAYLALASAVITALNSGLGASATAEVEQKAALAFRTLQDDVDTWRELHLPAAPQTEAVAKLDGFLARRNETLALTTACSYYIGRRDGRKLGQDTKAKVGGGPTA